MKPKRNQGFTLLEIIVSIIAMGLVLSVAAQYFVKKQSESEIDFANSEAIQNLNIASMVINQELRMAGYDPNRINFIKMPYNEDTLFIRADYNGNGTIDTLYQDTAEFIKYYCSTASHKIFREVIATRRGRPEDTLRDIILDSVDLFKIKYLDRDGNVIDTVTNQSAIRQINITITVHSAKKEKDYKPEMDYTLINGYRQHTVTFTVSPKNLDI